MKKQILLSSILLFFVVGIAAQSTYPIHTYTELPNPKPTDAALWAPQSNYSINWGSTDVRYKKQEPSGNSANKTHTLTAWKGERVSAQFVVSNKTGENILSYTISNLIKEDDANQHISAEQIFSGFVRYVMTDELNKDGSGGCGHRNPADFDYSLSADPIDHHIIELKLMPLTSQGVWLRVNIPAETDAGTYTGNVDVKLNGKTVETLQLSVKVQNHTLPAVSEWSYHLDLWQNPFSVARYHGVELWSEAHLEALRYEHQLYADAGGKVITASIIYDPWDGQTEDKYETMIEWTKKKDGTWEFDYTNFDKYVELMMSLGVNKQINCYSMIPWKLSFRYFDEASNRYIDASTKPGDALFEELWVTMLKSFAAHLKEKGWFEITHIAIDERPMDHVLKTLAVIRKADPNFKTSFAGNYHKELLNDIDDYCIAFRYKYTEAEVARRRAEGKVTTFYTCCTESYPNGFTFSPPAESEWLAWYAAKENLDGYLRWALNCWVQNPLQDSRFRSWAAGDTYQIYPGARTSIRFERLVEGIQQFEKIKILREYFNQAGHTTALLQIDNALADFDEPILAKTPAEITIANARKVINSLSEAELTEKSMLSSMIDLATDFMNKAEKGESPGEYSAANTAVLVSAIADATSVRESGTSDAEFKEARLTLWNELEIYKKSKNVPIASTDAEQVWYSFHTPLRESKYIAYQSDNGTLYGKNFSKNDDGLLWKLKQLNDGTFAIISKKGKSNISNNASYNTALSTSSTLLTSDGWKFTPTGDGKFFIITSGSVQVNQTNSGLGYRIYNWGGGNEMNDTGCKYIIRQESVTTHTPVTQNNSFSVNIIDKKLVVSDPNLPIRVFNISGQELSKQQHFPTGLIIVKTPYQAYKLAVH
ncbi:MAG TPA: DUF4091 domain-containing protein [Bacteroidales bacterium]|nr:DUF4091 domain-containing protein [Bacteroidales bacterium]